MLSTVLGALAIGATLGLMGSGGSTLTVPVLVYLLGHDGKVAIAESLAIVGCISLTAFLPYARAREVDWRSILLFGLPGMAGTFGGAWIAAWLSAALQLTLFGAVLWIAAVMMYRKSRAAIPETPELVGPPRQSWARLAGQGFGVGIVTGLVGVGGGFLIVPALVLLGGLSMRVAVGTSLAIIAMNSLSGFLKYVDLLGASAADIDWRCVVVFIVIGAIGATVGRRIAARINQHNLQRVFAVFLVAMGLFVLAKEVPKILRSLWREVPQRVPDGLPVHEEFGLTQDPTADGVPFVSADRAAGHSGHWPRPDGRRGVRGIRGG